MRHRQLRRQLLTAVIAATGSAPRPHRLRRPGRDADRPTPTRPSRSASSSSPRDLNIRTHLRRRARSGPHRQRLPGARRRARRTTRSSTRLATSHDRQRRRPHLHLRPPRRRDLPRRRRPHRRRRRRLAHAGAAGRDRSSTTSTSQQRRPITAADDHDRAVCSSARPTPTCCGPSPGRAGLVLESGATNDLSTTANGTGPFTLTTLEAGRQHHLRPERRLLGRRCRRSRRSSSSYIPDASAAVNATLAGDVDVQTALDATLAGPARRRADGITLTEGQDDRQVHARVQQPARSLQRPPRPAGAPLGHRPRRASSRPSAAPPSTQDGPIPELDPGYEDLSDVVRYDPEQAKALLAQAGQEDLVAHAHVPQLLRHRRSPTSWSPQLKAIGVTLTVDSVDFPTWLNDVYTNKDYDLSFVNHVEAHDFQQLGEPGLLLRLRQPQVQSLYAESLAATDPAVADEKLARGGAHRVRRTTPPTGSTPATTLTVVRDGVTGFPTVDSTSPRGSTWRSWP